MVEGSWGAWAFEVKTGPITLTDLRGLLEFHRRHPRFHPLVIGGPEARTAAVRAGIDAVDWHDFLLSGPPGVATGS